MKEGRRSKQGMQGRKDRRSTIHRGSRLGLGREEGGKEGGKDGGKEGRKEGRTLKEGGQDGRTEER